MSMNISHETITSNFTDHYEYVNNYFTSSKPHSTFRASQRHCDGMRTFFRIIFVFVSRIGFILIHLGSIPVENIYRIVFYNILETAVTILSYALLGFVVSFGKTSLAGWIGVGFSLDLVYDWEAAIVGFSACLIGSAQIFTLLASRLHVMGLIIISAIYSAFYQPLILHWIWSKHGWMNQNIFLKNRVSVKDHAGNIAVHLPSCLIGLTGITFLGRRLIKIDDLDKNSIKQSSSTFVGYLFIICGYMSFSSTINTFDSEKVSHNDTGKVLVNSLIAIASGIIVTALLSYIFYKKIFKYWITIKCIQGGLAGIISVAAGVQIYPATITAGLAATSSFLFFFSSVLIQNTALEDNCSFISSHLITSIIGAIACPVLTQNEIANFNTIIVLWQLICCGIVTACTTINFCFIFCLLSSCNILRHTRETLNHGRALVFQEQKPTKNFLKRLFSVNTDTKYIEPRDRPTTLLEEE